MADTSQTERADIKTRWQKGQSGNPTGRRITGAGATLTGLARTMLERPVERPGGGEPVTRLVEYMTDVVQRADAGDLRCRLFMLQLIDRGDRRKLTAQRNAKKARNEELRNFEQEKATEISPTLPPLPPEVIERQSTKVSPTVPPRSTVTSAPKRAESQRESLLASAAMYRRDPCTGRLMTPEGRVLSQQEEEKLLYPNWPHISPHLKKEGVSAASNAGDPAGPKSPAAASQGIDSTGYSGAQKNRDPNDRKDG